MCFFQIPYSILNLSYEHFSFRTFFNLWNNTKAQLNQYLILEYENHYQNLENIEYMMHGSYGKYRVVAGPKLHVSGYIGGHFFYGRMKTDHPAPYKNLFSYYRHAQ